MNITSSVSAPGLASSQGSSSEKILDTAEKFTAVFFTQFVSEMMKEQDCAGGFGEEIFQTVLAENIGQQITHSAAGESMIEMISQQLVQLQEKKASSPDALADPKVLSPLNTLTSQLGNISHDL